MNNKNYYKLENSEKIEIMSRINLLNQKQLEINDINIVLNSVISGLKNKAEVNNETQVIQWDETFSGFYINNKENKEEKVEPK